MVQLHNPGRRSGNRRGTCSVCELCLNKPITKKKNRKKEMENLPYKQRVPLSSVWNGGCGWCSAAQSCLTLLQPHGLHHTGLPCPSLSPGVCSNSCPLIRYCYLIISFSATPFSSCPQSFPASGSFPVSQLFASAGQSIGVSAFSISPS